MNQKAFYSRLGAYFTSYSEDNKLLQIISFLTSSGSSMVRAFMHRNTTHGKITFDFRDGKLVRVETIVSALNSDGKDAEELFQT